MGSAGDVRKQVLARVFGHGGTDQAMRTEFLEAYRQATFGQEEKGLGDRLDNLISRHHGHYQVLPQSFAWGQEEYIWVGITPWWKDARDIEAAAGCLMNLLQQDRLPENVIDRWRTFIDDVPKFGVGSSWPKEIDYLFSKLSADIEALGVGDLSIKIDKFTQQLSLEESRLALTLMAHIVGT